MAFKQGIPLLDAFEENGEEDEANGDHTYEPEHHYLPKKRKTSLKKLFCNRKMLLIIGITTFISLILFISLDIAIPIIIVHYGEEADRPAFEPLGNVTTSSLDTREYSALMLTNKIRVLLVSDSDTEESAAAMDVAVGSFSNPEEYQGLAHFCEHMLFYANKKYPEEGSYAAFLSTHGGYDNAYTSTQNTNYHFKINSDFLREALDRFAQFFISPILTQDAVSREVNAVDAEHRKNLQSDSWRQWQLLKHVSNPDHPFHMFSTGDLDTLDKPGVLDNLKTFYNTYYSANQMQLVIYGKESIKTLTEYAVDIFSSIEDKDITRPGFAPYVSFPDAYNGKIVYFIPVADTNKVSIVWEVPPLITLYREQISEFIAYLLNDEGHGSIIDSLRKQNWAFSLSAGVLVDTDTYTLMILDITLTNTGLSSVSDVIGTVIRYISVIRNSTDDELRKRWTDYVTVNAIQFKYAPKDDPDSFASSVASRMRDVSEPADFLSAPSRYTFNITDIRQTLSYMVPSKAVIALGSKKFVNTSAIEQTSTVSLTIPSSLSMVEPIYGTKYKAIDMDAVLLNYWERYTTPSPLHLPQPVDDFVPKDFSILSPANPPSQVPVSVDEDSNGMSVWWLQDTYYKKPKIDMYCDITISPSNYSLYDPKWTALTALYTTLVTTVLKPELYSASLVDYDIDVSPTAAGLTLQIEGFSDTAILERIMRIVVNALNNETLLGQQNLFDLALDSLINDLVNYNFTALPYRYVYQYYQSVVMDRPKWKNWQVIDVLRNITITTPDALLAHMRLLLMKGSSLLCFAHGNILKSEVVKLSGIVRGVLTNHLSEDPIGRFHSQRVSLSPGNYSVVVPALNPADLNSVVNVVFQIGNKCDITDSHCSAESLKSTGLLGLLTLQMQQACFDYLRSQLQLGYVAYCTNRANENVYSFQVLVQSGTYNISYILNNIDSFLVSYQKTLSDYLSSQENFDGLRSIFSDVVVRKPLTLSDASDDLWSQIQSGQRQFNFKEQVVNATKTLESSELLEFYKSKIVSQSSAKKVVIGIYGHDKEPSPEETEYFKYPIDYINLDPKATSYPTTKH